jgi:hypothetical protein
VKRQAPPPVAYRLRPRSQATGRERVRCSLERALQRFTGLVDLLRLAGLERGEQPRVSQRLLHRVDAVLRMRALEFEQELDVLVEGAPGSVGGSDVDHGATTSRADENLRVQTRELRNIRLLRLVIMVGLCGSIVYIEQGCRVVENLDPIEVCDGLRVEPRELLEAPDDRQLVWHLLAQRVQGGRADEWRDDHEPPHVGDRPACLAIMADRVKRQFVEAVRQRPIDPPDLVGKEHRPAPRRLVELRAGGSRHRRKGTDELGEGAVERDPALTIGQITVERQRHVPGPVEREIARQHNQPVPNCVLRRVRRKAQKPQLGMKDTADPRRGHRVHSVLEESQ